jgi:hypothetical protein
MILLGFEIGTGKRVEIPETGHLAWFGQTQLSGKTTALEAIAFRGGLRAVAFITKQGEGGFLTGKMIPPYFSEPTNDEEQPLWRWVKSILEASQQRKMNFEESWIIRACEDPKQAKTLLDVHENIKSLLGGQGDYVEKGRGKKKKHEWKYSRKPVSGMNAGIYTSLKAYFDIVMPQLARLPYTKKLVLGPGLNVMNLQEYAMETQALVIRSVMEWVYLHEKNTRIIVPEAQDFVPQGKNSPVKMACETLVRKAGANKNFMWLDSQDMAAVDKIMLRACSIVGIGVQTEGHEIDRSLASLFNPTLKAVDIARLKIGEFFVRTSEARVSKCYVQPAWMDSELHAQAIAKGEESVSSARQMLRAFKQGRESMKQGVRETGKPHELLQIQTLERDEHEHSETATNPANPDSGKATGIRAVAIRNGNVHEAVPGTLLRAGAGDGQESPESEDENETMWREKYEALHSEYKSLIEAHDALAARVRELTEGYEGKLERSAEALPKHLERQVSPATGNLQPEPSFNSPVPCDEIAPDGELCALAVGHAGKHSNLGPFRNTRSLPDSPVTSHQSPITSNGLSLTVPQLDYIYKFVKESAAKDAGILELLVARPELCVKVKRPTVTMDGESIIGRIARLIHDGYFSNPKNSSTVQKELKRRGCDQPTTNLYKPLNRLTEMGFLTFEPDGYQSVPGMKVQEHPPSHKATAG